MKSLLFILLILSGYVQAQDQTIGRRSNRVVVLGRLGIDSVDYSSAAADTFLFKAPDGSIKRGLFSNTISAIDGTTKILSGSVIWDSNFVFHNTTVIYQILGRRFTAAASTFSISPSHPTLDRFTVVYADTLGNIGTINGSNGSPADIPNVDPASQILLAVYEIKAGSTSPYLLGNNSVYRENIEWVPGSNITSADFDYPTNPFSGAVSAYFPGFTNGQYFKFTDAATYDLNNYSYIKFYIRLGASFTGKYISVKFNESGAKRTNYQAITDGSFGFNASLLNTWQLVAIPLSSFVFTDVNFNEVYFVMSGAGGAFQVDNVQLQSGGITIAAGVNSVNGMSGDVIAAFADSANINIDSTLYRFYNKYTNTLLFSLPTGIEKTYGAGGITLYKRNDSTFIDGSGISGGSGTDTSYLTNGDSVLNIKNTDGDIQSYNFKGGAGGSGGITDTSLIRQIVSDSSTLKLNISDTAAMLAAKANISDTSLFYKSGSSAIYIKGLKNLLVGTSTDDGHNLRVNGSVSFNLGSDATGDLFYRNSLGSFTRLEIGINGQSLRVSGGLPVWMDTIPGGSGGSGTVTGIGTTGRISFWNGSSSISSSADLLYDSTAALMNLEKSQNATTSINIANTSTGISAAAILALRNGSTPNDAGYLSVFGTSYNSPSFMDALVLRSASLLSGGIKISAKAGGIKLTGADSSLNSLVVANDGKVGVNIVPTQQFQVNGRALFANEDGVSSGNHIIADYFKQSAGGVGNAGATLGYAANGSAATNTFLYAPGGVDFALSSFNGTAFTNNIYIKASAEAIGIGTSSPNSRLHTNGSFATAYVAKSGAYTATISDHTIECTTGTFTITLPTSSGITGREYLITNTGSGTVTIGTTSSQTFVNVTGTPTTLTVAQFTSYKVISNGTNWIAFKMVN